MKKIMFIFSIFCVSIVSFSQRNGGQNYLKIKELVRPIEIDLRPSELDCTIEPHTNCNLIRNNNFTPTDPNASIPGYSVAGAPFNLGLVTNWYASHGTANLWDLFFYANSNNTNLRTPPTPATGFVWMACTSGDDTQTNNIEEGITQRIPTLITGEKYSLSFFKSYSTIFESNGTPFFNPLFSLKIELYNCFDFLNFPNPNNNYSIPLLGSHQTIYCEANPTNLDWERVILEFVANSNFNMIMITPVLTNFYNSNIGIKYGGGFALAYPELINIQNFSAGNYTIPTPNNCTVTIGPSTPNCGVYGSVFTWIGPNGQSIPAPLNQQIQISTSIPANLGTWTLQMTIPNSVTTNNTCSINAGNIQASVNVTECEYWPKAYVTKPATRLIKASNGNIFLSAVFPNIPYLNHNGYYPPSSTSDYLIQYNLSGTSTWGTNSSTNFVLNNGVVQMNDLTYRNSSTGITVSGPSSIPATEALIAETSFGGYITSTNFTTSYGSQLPYYGNLILRLNNISNSLQINNRAFIKYNPQSHELFLVEENINLVKIFDISNNTFVLTNQFNYSGEIVQINNNHEIFIVRNSQFFKFSNNIYTLISTVNFVNSNIGTGALKGSCSDNIYTENNVLLQNTGNNFLYSLDLSNPLNIISKSILLSGTSEYLIKYIYNNNDIFLTLSVNLYPTQFFIGNQSINQNINSGTLLVFTKLNLDTDFSKSAPLNQSIESLNIPSISINPNPSSTEITVNSMFLNENDNYSIIIGNQFSKNKIVLKNYFLKNRIDITKLEKGANYISLIDKKGNCYNTLFIKH